MHGFSHRHTVQAALAWLDAQLRPQGAELVPLREAAGRILAAPVVSGVDVPGFDRATMDGYAVVADSIEGASSYNRVPLRVIGDAMPGHPFAGSITSGEAVRIMTGAPIPDGADAVLPAEFAEPDAEAAGRQDHGPAEAGPYDYGQATAGPYEHSDHVGCQDGGEPPLNPDMLLELAHAALREAEAGGGVAWVAPHAEPVVALPT